MNLLSSVSVPRPFASEGDQRGLGFALVGLLAVLAAAILAGLSLGAGAAQASFPGTNGKIACVGPLGPNPPPAGQSFLEVFTMNPAPSIDPATGAPTSQIRLTDNTVTEVDPTYSADGTKIVYISANNVWKMNADGTNKVQLTTENNTDRVGGWSPDGSKIVYQKSVLHTPTASNFEIFTMNADGTGQTNITNNPGSPTVGGNDSQPSWSPAGNTIAFHSNRNGQSNIWVMNADGTNPRVLTTDSLAEESAPEYSPDGQQIAFQSDRGFAPTPAGQGRNLEIYRMNAADGSNVTRLTFNEYNPADTSPAGPGFGAFDLEPYWSPDGSRIVFHSGRNFSLGRTWDVFTVGAVNGEHPTLGSPALEYTRRALNDFRCSWGNATATQFNLLSVAKAGSGEGTVTSSPAGINCGTTPTALDCAEAYAAGTQVTLTAAPAANGSTFDGFTTGCATTPTPTTCTVTMDAAKSVTATFTDANPTLTVSKLGSGATGPTSTGDGTVTSAPAGIDCGVDCTEEYALNSSVQLTAAPAAGSTFSGFSGCDSVAGNVCTVTVDRAKTVRVTFSGPLLTVTRLGDGAASGNVSSSPLGIACGIKCSEVYATNTVVTLTATAFTFDNATAASFAGFSGCDSTPTANTCTVTMDQARNVIAFFVDHPTLTVTKTGAGAGSVTSVPEGLNCGTTCTRDFTKNSTVTLTAAPVAGSRFNGFTGCASTPTPTTCTVTMDQAKTVTANFVVVRALTVVKAGTGSGTVTSLPAGIDCGADCSESYDNGTSVTLTAAPATGSTFTGFTGCATNPTPTTCTVTMDAAKSVTATFAGIPRNLSVTKAGSGSGTITSTPAGINCGLDCTEDFNNGTSVTLTASPAGGSSFNGFTGGGCSGSGTTCTVTMDAAKSVTATFTLVSRGLSVSKAGNGSGTVISSPAGINCGSDCAGTYLNGTVVTLTATPAAGSSFTGFTGGGCSGSGTTCTVTMDQFRAVTATFAIKTIYPTPPVNPPVVTPPDTTRPVLGPLSMSSSVFQAAASGPAFTARVGTRVSFTLSEPGSVRFTVQRKARGRRVAGRCRRQTAANRSKPACIRWVKVRGSFTVPAKKGTNRFKFRGRIGGRKLRPARYRLSARATDKSGNRSGLRRKSFRIVR